MNNTVRKTITLLLGSALLSANLATAAPKLKTGSDADVSYDGLHRIDAAALDAAWVKPDLDLSGYTKIMLVPAGMTFKTPRRSDNEFPLTEQQKQQVQKILAEAFTTALGKNERFAVTDQPGRDVLLVYGAVLDVESHVPPERAGRGGYLLRSIGEATLLVELRDSMSDEILVRAVDHRAAETARLHRSNSVTNTSELQLAAARWARSLNKQLEELARL